MSHVPDWIARVDRWSRAANFHETEIETSQRVQTEERKDCYKYGWFANVTGAVILVYIPDARCLSWNEDKRGGYVCSVLHSRKWNCRSVLSSMSIHIWTLNATRKNWYFVALSKSWTGETFHCCWIIFMSYYNSRGKILRQI